MAHREEQIEAVRIKAELTREKEASEQLRDEKQCLKRELLRTAAELEEAKRATIEATCSAATPQQTTKQSDTPNMTPTNRAKMDRIRAMKERLAAKGYGAP